MKSDSIYEFVNQSEFEECTSLRISDWFRKEYRLYNTFPSDWNEIFKYQLNSEYDQYPMKMQIKIYISLDKSMNEHHPKIISLNKFIKRDSINKKKRKEGRSAKCG